MDTVNPPITAAGLPADAVVTQIMQYATPGMISEANREIARKGAETRSRNWRFDPRVPCLLQYVPSGTYYVRVKFGGKIIRKSLATSVHAEAKIRLLDFLRDLRLSRPDKVKSTDWRMAHAAATYIGRQQKDPTLSARSVEYRETCLKAIRKSWPGWDDAKIEDIKEEDVRTWAADRADEYDEQYYNNLVSTFRAVVDIAAEVCGKPHPDWENPLRVAKRLGVKPKELTLPEASQFVSFLEWLDKHPGASEAGVLIRLMAFFGLRHCEALAVSWCDFDWVRGELRVGSAKKRASDNASAVRRVPMIPEARAWFEPRSAGRAPLEPVAKIASVRCWLEKAHRELGLPHLSNHDFRHLFATRCIEAGVDVPTVSRWLGHKDGGILAMKTYGHLRNEHSQAAALKVSFAGPTPTAPCN